MGLFFHRLYKFGVKNEVSWRDERSQRLGYAEYGELRAGKQARMAVVVSRRISL